jgi:hypothetical protein
MSARPALTDVRLGVSDCDGTGVAIADKGDGASAGKIKFGLKLHANAAIGPNKAMNNCR